MTKRETRPNTGSKGNGSVLVVIDTSQPEYGQVNQTITASLEHCGIPYAHHDVSQAEISHIAASGCSAIVVAQEHLWRALSKTNVAAILAAVESGTGLVNCDPDIAEDDGALLDVIGISIAKGRRAAGGTETVLISTNDHYVSYTQSLGYQKKLYMPVPVTIARATHADVTTIAESDCGAPLLVARASRRGRVVQWLISPRLWLRQYCGHAAGLDDLFWKSIVWVARKPFVMMAMPPFVRLRFDDCTGIWRNKADFGFVDVLNEFGHVPSLCVCMRAITPDGAEKVHQLYSEGKAEIAPHTLTGDKSLFWGDEHGEYSEEQCRELMREVAERLRGWGVKPSKILSDHDHEHSAHVLPFLKELGISYKMNITIPGERWNDIHVDWKPAPYGSMSYALDYQPETGLFAVFAHYQTFDYARAYLPDGRFLYNRAGGFGPYKWDFLNGLTTYQGEQDSNDIEGSARRLAEHTRLGLDSLFFGGSISHTHFLRELSLAEWRLLCERYEALTARYEKRNVGYDFIAEYARSRYDSHLNHVDVTPSEVHCSLSGTPTVPLELYVFRQIGLGIEHRYEEIPVFNGETSIALVV